VVCLYACFFTLILFCDIPFGWDIRDCIGFGLIHGKKRFGGRGQKSKFSFKTVVKLTGDGMFTNRIDSIQELGITVQWYHQLFTNLI